MSHVNSGHTDKATINARKPLTAGMRSALDRLSRDHIAMRHAEQDTKNRVRALIARGYAEQPGDFAYITEAGRAALKST